MSSYEYFEGITHQELVESIVSTSFKKFHSLQASCEAADLNFDDMFGSKNQSELLSKIFEKVAAEKYTEFTSDTVINPRSDNDPDLYFTQAEKPLEIKVTCGDTWTGGTFSKRPADYLLISWDKDTKGNCFVALAHLKKSDWLPGGNNYYGTRYPKSALYGACVDNKAKVLYGGLEKTNRGHKIIKKQVKNGE